MSLNPLILRVIYTLDLVITSPGITLDQLSVKTLSCPFNSDHFLINFISLCTISSSVKSKPGYAYDFSKANSNEMCSFLLDSDFSTLFELYVCLLPRFL